ncbi:MAG: glycerol-3-phosphate dehydrogenase [Natronomonas sp.]|jgi:glycerol-3-phosphate dehydrogenase|uniref:FAD-dependent oxidoreductase n=1 Tax=Natronomonas sp. TaxID=2184060 RepID=UPI0039890068
MAETDVIIVGGGATGVGIARDLAMRGADVQLYERGGLGTGTTGHSHGVLHSGARYATTDPEGASECIRENDVLRDIAGEAVRETGGLFVQLPGDDPQHCTERLSACRDLGIPAEELSPAEARDIEPELSPRVERAFRVPDGVIYPSRLVAATAVSAREHGASIHVNTPVSDILVDDGCVVGVETVDGERKADHVINAGGAWASRIANLADIDVPMAPTSGVMVSVAVPTVDSVINRCRPPTDGDIAVPHESRIVLGTTSTDVDDPETFPKDEAAVETMVREGVALLPAVTDAAIEDVYWGVRPLYGGGGGRGRDASRGFQVLDHTSDGRPGLTTVTGGKLTTHRLMAEAVTDAVCDHLGIEEPCRTERTPLPADDAETLDRWVGEFDAVNPADADEIG